MVRYSLYLVFSGILIAGWMASYATGQYLYTAMGMFVYAVSPLFFSLYNQVRKNGNNATQKPVRNNFYKKAVKP